MKFAFSTLGCPSWGYHDLVSTAKDLGYDGIEIRGIADQLYAPKIKAFNEQNLAVSLARLGTLELPMLTSNACIADKDCDNAVIEAQEYIQLAAKIGAKYIRVLCTNSVSPDGKGDFDLAVTQYYELCEFAKRYNVTPLIETNGMFCDSALVAKFMLSVGNDNSGVLWDIHHPYRFNGESMDDTVANIGKYIKYVHIKDSIAVDDKIVYKMLGQGDLPLKVAVKALKKIGYDGYITLEWVKRWNPDLEEPGIVFAHYISKIKQLTK